jgi:NADH-ubiquinone oxidoreductase chain 5
MEAPVPASSLIHSATLVSAGVYLILRFNFIFDSTQYSKFIIPVIGSLTAAYGGVCAAAQSDIKKTLAYSTISHCGFLMVLCATEMNEFTILYLYVHGFFKAGVFMCVGNVLRITRGYQDTRRMGGLLKYLPFEYFCAIVGVLNLAGLPFTFGFFIKHLLLISLDTHIYIYYFVMFHSLVGAFSGLFYSYRIINYTFGDFKKGQKVLYSNLNRNNYNCLLYTNSSLAATLSVFFLFIFSYLITYFMFKYFMVSNYIFSDYMNTTTLTNYYATVNSFNGYLLNFSYINLTVVSIFTALFFSRYRKIPRYYI